MRRLLILIVVLAAALVTAGTVSASAVRVEPVTVATTPTLDPYWSGACGYEVDWQITGTVYTTLVLDKDGVVVSQIDTSPDMLYTLTAPSNETSLTLKSARTVHYTYPEGATLGAPVEVAMTGMNDKHEGLPASAGVQTFSGHVTGFVGQVPQWEGAWGGAEWIDTIGQWNDESEVVAVVCASLSSG